MPLSGADPMLKGDIYTSLRQYAFECKNQEALNIWDSLKQAENQCRGPQTPVLVFRRNNSATYAVVPVNEFIRLLVVEKEKDPENIKQEATGDRRALQRLLERHLQLVHDLRSLLRQEE